MIGASIHCCESNDVVHKSNTCESNANIKNGSNIGASIIGASIQGTSIIECFPRAVAVVE